MELPTVDELAEAIAEAMGTGQVLTVDAAAEAAYALLVCRRRRYMRDAKRRVRAKARERLLSQQEEPQAA